MVSTYSSVVMTGNNFEFLERCKRRRKRQRGRRRRRRECGRTGQGWAKGRDYG